MLVKMTTIRWCHNKLRTFFVSVYGREPTALLDIREAFVDFPCVFPLLAVLLQLSISDSLGLLSSSLVEAFDLR